MNRILNLQLAAVSPTSQQIPLIRVNLAFTVPSNISHVLYHLHASQQVALFVMIKFFVKVSTMPQRN